MNEFYFEPNLVCGREASNFVKYLRTQTSQLTQCSSIPFAPPPQKNPIIVIQSYNWSKNLIGSLGLQYFRLTHSHITLILLRLSFGQVTNKYSLRTLSFISSGWLAV